MVNGCFNAGTRRGASDVDSLERPRTASTAADENLTQGQRKH
jgi:hypothetical protein